MSADGSDRKVVLETNDRFRLLGLSAGQTELIYAKGSTPPDSGPILRSMEILSFSLETGKVRKLDLVNDAYFYNVQLSKGGSSIAYVTRNDNVTRIFTLELASKSRKELLTITDPKVFVSSISWSPDGSSLVFGKQTRTNLLSMLTE